MTDAKQGDTVEICPFRGESYTGYAAYDGCRGEVTRIQGSMQAKRIWIKLSSDSRKGEEVGIPAKAVKPLSGKEA